MSVEKAFEVDSLLIGELTGIVTGIADPNSPGFAAPIGSLYLRSNGLIYRKTGATDTDWTQMDTGGGGLPLEYIVDELYSIDPTRASKKLGISLIQFHFGRDEDSVKDKYLEIVAGVTSNESSYHLPYDATLVAIMMGEEENTQTWTAEVRRNGSATVLDSLQIINDFTNSSITKDTDFASGDVIQVFLNSGGDEIPFPVVTLHFRRRAA